MGTRNPAAYPSGLGHLGGQGNPVSVCELWVGGKKELMSWRTYPNCYSSKFLFLGIVIASFPLIAVCRKIFRSPNKGQAVYSFCEGTVVERCPP